ncbi:MULTISPECIES: FAD:protein FMN transferase [unclassified Wenzhouxiangella]|uniref:FAD:protein FMN transferase n=1 Tax=unclassified Wenzhouxiangella TaxID=2613841 RepID=UPI0015F28C38|nr:MULTISPECIES: FAD:protein FMN transferase [unclassified Wenzhouxiangella]
MRTLLFSLLVASLLSACGREPQLTHHRLAAFGTEVTITLHAKNDTPEAIAAIDREFQRMHRQWHAWEPGRLADINQAIAEDREITLSAETIEIIRHARELEAASGGLFNPAIGRLLSQWGFHASDLPDGPPPPEARVAKMVEQAPSMSDLELGDETVSSSNPAVQLDFGAYIKGVAVARALDILVGAGVEHAIVNAGGDLGVIGRRGSRPWRAAVQHPDGEGGHYLAGLNVEDGEFVFTSGNYRRYRQGEGIRHGHIVDPRNGYPADQVSSVTVIASEGGRADAAATALAVAGAEEWGRVARDLSVERVMRVDADGTIHVTAAMADRLHWREQPGSVRVTSLPESR